MDINDFMLTCPSKKYLGIECLGCGAQRAIVLVFEGKFSEAFQLYPAVYTLLLFFLILGVSFIDKKRKYSKTLMALVVVNLVIMIIGYLYKHH
ncbi:hypothetical protein J2795_000644 [Chryseobacterium bernardetii]|jgi:hypothetical protein|uniref:Uncharacterized protein DUF2752 n=3 Tax=Chryseobacterium TaxID=59732 RepID=A0A543EMB0_9FLAO|nr:MULTISPECIES: DUF2752 domain-containing protein [Chryseobacterium]MDR6369118.1 hypothetical protein [Chryseobacterium vietnamense]MDR6439959.1 hypothetical protein [Chryseobacterium bernardetii]MDR6459557.1 hypothetical protein [Chryseobacterium vietnamense]TQM22723.1 uncharacterized protein DUF2752 [Chryseobacterium aquifrigidense]